MLNQADYSSSLENHRGEGEAKRKERRRGKKSSIPSACHARSKLRATAVLKSTDRIKFDFSMAVARCLKQASPFSRVAFQRAFSCISHTLISLRENKDYSWAIVLDRQDKLKTDFYFQAIAVGSMQLMYIW